MEYEPHYNGQVWVWGCREKPLTHPTHLLPFDVFHAIPGTDEFSAVYPTREAAVAALDAARAKVEDAADRAAAVELAKMPPLTVADVKTIKAKLDAEKVGGGRCDHCGGLGHLDGIGHTNGWKWDADANVPPCDMCHGTGKKAGGGDAAAELLAACKAAHGLISGVVIGVVMGLKPGPDAEAEVNRVTDMLAAAIARAEGVA